MDAAAGCSPRSFSSWDGRMERVPLSSRISRTRLRSSLINGAHGGHQEENPLGSGGSTLLTSSRIHWSHSTGAASVLHHRLIPPPTLPHTHPFLRQHLSSSLSPLVSLSGEVMWGTSCLPYLSLPVVPILPQRRAAKRSALAWRRSAPLAGCPSRGQWGVLGKLKF